MTLKTAIKQILREFVGTADVVAVASILIMLCLGVLASLLIYTTNRDKNDLNNPRKFNLKFFFTDNWQRLLLTAILLLVSLQFTQDIFGVELNKKNAFWIGMNFDKLAELFQNKKLFIKNKK